MVNVSLIEREKRLLPTLAISLLIFLNYLTSPNKSAIVVRDGNISEVQISTLNCLITADDGWKSEKDQEYNKQAC